MQTKSTADASRHSPQDSGDLSPRLRRKNPPLLQTVGRTDPPRQKPKRPRRPRTFSQGVSGLRNHMHGQRPERQGGNRPVRLVQKHVLAGTPVFWGGDDEPFWGLGHVVSFSPLHGVPLNAPPHICGGRWVKIPQFDLHTLRVQKRPHPPPRF